MLTNFNIYAFFECRLFPDDSVMLGRHFRISLPVNFLEVLRLQKSADEQVQLIRLLWKNQQFRIRKEKKRTKSTYVLILCLCLPLPIHDESIHVTKSFQSLL